MRVPAIGLAAALLASGLAVAKDSDKGRKEFEEWARGLDSVKVHRLVQTHENDPLSDLAKDLRPTLEAHFKPLDYVVCLDQVGFLLDQKDKIYAWVFWQVVFASGDYFEQGQKLGQPADPSTYMLYGLQSGLKAYENVLAKKPKIRLKALDDLIALRDTGRLPEYIKSKPCDQELEKGEGQP